MEVLMFYVFSFVLIKPVSQMQETAFLACSDPKKAEKYNGPKLEESFSTREGAEVLLKRMAAWGCYVCWED
jgi:hypothetical protein